MFPIPKLSTLATNKLQDIMPKDTKPRTAKRDVVKRAKKDPDAPKRALSSYMLFAQDQRSVVQAEQPNIAFGKCNPPSYHPAQTSL